MGVKYTRSGSGGRGGQSYRQMARDMQSILEEEFEVAGRAGQGEGQGFIAIAGTGRQWEGLWPSSGGGRRSGAPGGRIDSGAMQRAFEYRIGRGGQSLTLDVGWVDDSKWEPYMSAQDQGFSAGGFRPDKMVEGMGLLAHMSYYMRDQTDAAMDRATRRIVNGL